MKKQKITINKYSSSFQILGNSQRLFQQNNSNQKLNKNQNHSKYKSARSWTAIKQKLKKQKQSKIKQYELLLKEKKAKELRKQIQNMEVYVWKQTWNLDDRVCRDLCMKRFTIIEKDQNKKQPITNIFLTRSKFIR